VLKLRRDCKVGTDVLYFGSTSQDVKPSQLLMVGHIMHRDELTAHQRRLKLLKVKAAYYGLDCPPHILLEIEDVERLLKK
jgi:hypothetical protein